jgi:hypothetical protein
VCFLSPIQFAQVLAAGRTALESDLYSFFDTTPPDIGYRERMHGKDFTDGLVSPVRALWPAIGLEQDVRVGAGTRRYYLFPHEL